MKSGASVHTQCFVYLSYSPIRHSILSFRLCAMYLIVHAFHQQFTENVVFLARDQLRVERGVIDQNLQTRAMAKALIDGSRLAVFDATCVGYGIVLSCGQHIATKVGNELYSSARSMIPVMRNTYVYFEISVSPSMIRNDPNSSGMHPVMDTATLLVGLSTLEMPLDTLVGAYPGTVGLCSSGQILQSGQWRSLSNTEDSCFGSSSTVGCLVYLDDSSAYRRCYVQHQLCNYPTLFIKFQ